MKFLTVSLLISATTLFSMNTFASGFVCRGQGYSAKLYNEVDPSRGTQNPGILIVSGDSTGTIATIRGSEIDKSSTSSTVVYEGRTNDYKTGRFLSVSLSVAKQPLLGSDGTQHHGRLVVNADNGHWVANMVCNPYLKQ